MQRDAWIFLTFNQNHQAMNRTIHILSTSRAAVIFFCNFYEQTTRNLQTFCKFAVENY